MDFTNTIQISQMIINELAGSAFVHKMQGQLFKSQGFTKLLADPKAYIEADLKLQKEGVEALYKMMPALAGDPTTYDLTKAYLLDEEEDQYWDEEQMDLIEKIGYQNWLVKQL